MARKKNPPAAGKARPEKPAPGKGAVRIVPAASGNPTVKRAEVYYTGPGGYDDVYVGSIYKDRAKSFLTRACSH